MIVIVFSVKNKKNSAKLLSHSHDYYLSILCSYISKKLVVLLNVRFTSREDLLFTLTR